MRNAPKTRSQNRHRFHLPFQFSGWVESGDQKMVMPPEFTDVYFDSCHTHPSLFRHFPSGCEFEISIEYDFAGNSYLGEGFVDMLTAMPIGDDPARLDFIYVGKGLFRFAIGDDSDQPPIIRALGVDDPYTRWNRAREEVERRLR